jgi:acyl-CoA thioesterase
MALATAAAYETVSSDFDIDTLHTHFLLGPKADQPLTIRVSRLSDSGKFATRVVVLEQTDKTMVHATCTFAKTSAMGGPTMTHSTGRASSQAIDAITLDDLEPGRTSAGPVMKYQRLPLEYTGREPTPDKSSPQSWTYASAASINSPIDPSDKRLQALGIIQLSDYHILDAPPTLHGIPFGISAINDTSRTPTKNSFQLFTSLNHTVRFHVHEGFRADELNYIEVNCPWTNRRRAEVQSRIFDGRGSLIATVIQGPYYVLKDEKGESKL